ncbi:FAD-dependent oxidoreductase [Branchiibius sp. NY16-3462-2]|uniref:FAD-dependent oxidoreductase n=1 Tax=Branchiibius sp. NY16-3462-2 TaxID=1807500 RepID=UPI000794B5F0|nr:FAD-dependent oxidoreductase [Branchiibius sp. NY16-3462-2]KYH44666.1 3-hydroxyacyl-CoA dehydrogenase [Branchiibius sp. NY16-3462-2]
MVSEVEAVRYERDENDVVTLILDDPSGSANVMNDAYTQSMHRAVRRLAEERDGLTGVIVTSAKKTFFAGGDLTMLSQITPATAGDAFAAAQAVKADLRSLETLGLPVVAVLNGTALGGGLEIALACHHRIAVEGRGTVFGLPEVTLGLLPGGGGVTRTVRMFGIANAVTNVLLEGKSFPPAKALELGLVDEVVGSVDEGLRAARAWIAEHPDAVQPWDEKGYRMPGGFPRQIADQLSVFPAILVKQLKGAPYPAPRAILAVAVEGAQVDFDTATRIESRYLVELASGPITKNMIKAFFFDLQTIKKGGSRPAGIERTSVSKVVVLGAGMMGAGIAYQLAKSGIDVVLKDVSPEAAATGKGYSQGLVTKAVSRGRMTSEAASALLDRITPTAAAEDAAGCDAVIEAVFESPELKQQVFAEVAPFLAPDALLCSNTSTLPITLLASGVDRPADFIGLHFFSPVDKMPLVEIIRGEQTSDSTLARAFDLTLAMKKTPIVVHDSRGFFTSRVIGTFVNEGLAMLAEGVSPVSLERAATQAGYPVGPLQLSDELNLELMAKIADATAAAAGEGYVEHPGTGVVRTMLAQDRAGKKAGAGFYDYADGRRTSLWSGLATTFPQADPIPFEDVQERMLFVEALESVKCVQEGVLTSVADANIGSIMGIGFPAWTGGVLQYINGYEHGLKGFIARAGELQDRYGDRFAVPSLLQEMADQDKTFS